MKSWINQLLFFARFAVIGLFVAAIALVYQGGGPRKMLREWLQEPADVPETRAGLQASYRTAVETAAPSVVNVYADKLFTQRRVAFLRDPQLSQFVGRPVIQSRVANRTELGSGVILDSTGYLVTNHHVISGAEGIKVSLWDGRVTSATVVGSDLETDLAVLAIDIDDLPTAPIGNESDLGVGDVVLAIGNPFGLGKTVTMGIISATGRVDLDVNLYEDFIQTDAAINRGNSGGALINTRGEIIGINTATLNRSAGVQGISFAIPVSLAQDVMKQILDHGRVIRGWLGIEFDDVRRHPNTMQTNQVSNGALISVVVPGSPASVADLMPGDIIIEFQGQPVTDLQTLYRFIADTPPGTNVEIGVVRNGSRFGTNTTLIQRASNLSGSG